MKYKGISEKQYNKALKEYSKRMFKLFDKDKSFNSNKGSSLMWLGSFTSRYIARDVVDYSIKNKISLFEALIIILKECNPNASNSLNQLLAITN